MSYANHSLTIRAVIPAGQGMLGSVLAAIADAGGDVVGVDIVRSRKDAVTRDITIHATDEAHGEALKAAVSGVQGVTIEGVSDRIFLSHVGGKVGMQNRVPIASRDDLSMAYTPGVARVCMAIHHDFEQAWDYTIKGNSVMVVSDGSSVVGEGDLGPEAALPAVEAKCMFQRKLEERLDIPVFHDDQQGTAVALLAALTNALRVAGKELGGSRVVVAGLGPGGMSTVRLLVAAGVGDVIACDSQGSVHGGRPDLDAELAWVAEHTNAEGRTGDVRALIEGADAFIGLSVPNLLGAADVRRMASDAAVFAMAMPEPEISPDAVRGAVKVYGTGRPDVPNQINSSLAFPGIWRGALDCRASKINEAMILAAAEAIAKTADADGRLAPDNVVPSVFNDRLVPNVAAAVREAASATGVARR